jgi:poly-gamma-glutamate synthesis protein (capsule biosynthesis protein)
MAYYGGGADRAEAESVLYLTAGGQRIAFIGFNEAGPPEAWATDIEAGAARLSMPLFEEKMGEATAGAPIVFAMVQCTNEHEPVPWRPQVRLFRRAIDLGAPYRSSSAPRATGHRSSTGAGYHYGLGNFSL